MKPRWPCPPCVLREKSQLCVAVGLSCQKQTRTSYSLDAHTAHPDPAPSSHLPAPLPATTVPPESTQGAVVARRPTERCEPNSHLAATLYHQFVRVLSLGAATLACNSAGRVARIRLTCGVLSATVACPTQSQHRWLVLQTMSERNRHKRQAATVCVVRGCHRRSACALACLPPARRAHAPHKQRPRRLSLRACAPAEPGLPVCVAHPPPLRHTETTPSLQRPSAQVGCCRF